MPDDDLAQRAARHRPSDGWPTCPRCGGPAEQVESEVGPAILMARPWMHLVGLGGQVTHCGCALCSEDQAERDQLRAALAAEQAARMRAEAVVQAAKALVAASVLPPFSMLGIELQMAVAG